MKPPSFRHLVSPLCLAVALTLANCSSVKKGADAAAPAEKKETDAAADTKKDAPAGNSKKDGEKKDPAAPAAETKKNEAKPAETKEEPKPDPLAAEEFKGLPKGEAAFLLACRTAGAAGKAMATGRDGLVFASGDLRALGANPKAGTKTHQAVVAAITAYAAKLKAAGIGFVLAPVPPKPVVYPDFVSAEAKVKDKRFDSYLQALYAELAKAGVQVVDVTKPLRSDRFDRNAASFPKAGTVWSPAAAGTAAEAIYKSVKRTDAAKGLTRDKTITSKKVGVAQNGETFNTLSVDRDEGGTLVAAAAPKEGAPVLVVGDANAAAYRTPGQTAGLGDRLSLAFGVPVETRSEASLGWKSAAGKFTPKKDGATRLVVWSFSATDFLGEPAAAPSAKPSGRPVRRSPGAGSASEPSDPASPPPNGAALKLRDDPGVSVRPD